MHVSRWAKSLSVLLILGLFLTGTAAFCRTNTDGESRRMILTRYSGHKDFHSRSTQAWRFNGETFAAEEAGVSHQLQFRDCESYLAEQQEFPLHKMVESDYISPEQVEELKNLGIKLNVDQVNFLQMERSEKVTATLWSIAAQIFDEGKAGLGHVLMPWQKDPKRANLKLDRGKYKYVWEWGRAAQDIPKEIGPLYAANALLNYVELKAHGGRLEDAYVMFHSLDKVNTRYYLQQHPDSVFPPGWSNADDCLFLVPLAEMLKKYPARHASEQVATLIRFSNNKIDDREAIDLLMANKLYRWDELDLTLRDTGRQNSPLIINDMSVGRFIFLDLMLRTYNLESLERDSMLRYLVSEVRPLLHSYNSRGKYDNASDSLLTSYDYRENNAIEVSNLDPKMAENNPDYVREVIFASYVYYIKRIAGALVSTSDVPPEKSFDIAVAEFARKNIGLGVSTPSGLIAKQLEALKPLYKSATAKTVSEFPINPQDPVVKEHAYWFNDNQIFIFNFDQLKQMIAENPAIFMKSIEALKAGGWRTRYFLNQVDLF